MDYKLKIVNWLCCGSIRFVVYRNSIAPKRSLAISSVFAPFYKDNIYGLPEISIPEFKAYTIARYESVYGPMLIEDLTNE